MQTNLTSERRSAFDALREVVRELEARGRQTVSAGVKPELQRRTLGGFNERRLGFSSFSAFLAAAEEAGYVARTTTEHGHTFVTLAPLASVVPEGGARIEPPERPAPGRRLRRDLWRAFVDWREDILRFFDRELGQARVLPAEASRSEVGDDAELRHALAAQPDRFIEIKPIPMEQQLEWIRDFVQTHREQFLAEELSEALAAARPVQAFSQLIRTDAALLQEWNRTRLHHVGSVVEAWIGEHELGINPWEETALRGSPLEGRPLRSEGNVEVPAEFEVERLRQSLHRALDRMPAGELLRLPIPVEYLVGTGL